VVLLAAAEARHHEHPRGARGRRPVQRREAGAAGGAQGELDGGAQAARIPGGIWYRPARP
jgi:hypothetical protein